MPRPPIARRALLGGLLATGTAGLAVSCTPRAQPAPGTARPASAPVVIGRIGSVRGLAAPGADAVMAAIEGARVDLASADEGSTPAPALREALILGGGALEAADPGTAAQRLAEQGCGAVIACVDDEELMALAPPLIERGIAILSLASRATTVREAVAGAGLLLRPVPTDPLLAPFLAAEVAVRTGSAGGGQQAAVRVAVLGRTGSSAAASLTAALRTELAPRGGAAVLHEHPASEPEAAAVAEDLLGAVLAEGPSALVLGGGAESAALLAVLGDRLLAARDAEQRAALPRVLLLPEATRAYGAALPHGALTGAIGMRCGRPLGSVLDGAFRDELWDAGAGALPGEAELPIGRMAAAYDALVLLHLATRASGAVDGPGLIAALGGIVAGEETCEELDDCLRAQRGGASPAYLPRSGPLELGSDGDPIRASLTRLTYSAQNLPVDEQAVTLERNG